MDASRSEIAQVPSATVQSSWEFLASSLDGLVGVVELHLEGVQDALDLVGGVADAPQCAALSLHGPAADEVLGDGPEAEHGVQLAGDLRLLPAEDLDVGQL